MSTAPRSLLITCSLDFSNRSAYRQNLKSPLTKGPTETCEGWAQLFQPSLRRLNQQKAQFSFGSGFNEVMKLKKAKAHLMIRPTSFNQPFFAAQPSGKPDFLPRLGNITPENVLKTITWAESKITNYEDRQSSIQLGEILNSDLANISSGPYGKPKTPLHLFKKGDDILKQEFIATVKQLHTEGKLQIKIKKGHFISEENKQFLILNDNYPEELKVPAS